MYKLLLLFTLVPLIELWLLLEVGKVIGVWPTIIIVASTGFAGVFLAKSQGLWIIYKMQAELAQGIIPGEQLFDGLCVLIGGVVLLTPGLLTDLFGFFLLIPSTRRYFKAAVRRYLQRKLDDGTLLTWHRR
jgi:UPF0716 protein FxsA